MKANIPLINLTVLIINIKLHNYKNKNYKKYKEECNHLGIKYDESIKNYLDLRIVPAKLERDGASDVTLDYRGWPATNGGQMCIYPVGKNPTKTNNFDIDKYVHEGTEIQTNDLDKMRCAFFTSWDEIPQVDVYVTTREGSDDLPNNQQYYDELRPTKLWCGWTYHIDDITDYRQISPHNFEYYTDVMVFNPTMALREIEGYETVYSETIANAGKINTTQAHELNFCDEIETKDINKTWIIKGHKYACEKIEVHMNNKGIKKIKKGTFYRIEE